MDAIPHLRLPLRIEAGRFATVEQDTLDEVIGCVDCICSFPIGSRDERPDFGITELEFQTRPFAVMDIEQAIEAWEPRAEVSVIESDYDPNDPSAATVRVEVEYARGEDF